MITPMTPITAIVTWIDGLGELFVSFPICGPWAHMLTPANC